MYLKNENFNIYLDQGSDNFRMGFKNKPTISMKSLICKQKKSQ